MKIYIVISAYNEKSHIASVLKDVSKSGLPIVVVDDGSVDKTAVVLSRYTKHHSRITKLTHRVNLGKGAAMKTGADYAFSQGADAVVFMDGDGQHKASDLPKFVKALESNKYDIVFGSRNLSYGVPLMRFLGNKFASVLVAFLFHRYITDLLCGFRGITKKTYNKIRWESAGYGAETEMVVNSAKRKLSHCEVPVTTLYYDDVKGVTMLDAINILFDVIRWRLTK